MSEGQEPDYIFLECNADNSFEITENNNRWINQIEGGVTLPENAKLSVQFAGINILGSGSDVVEFKNEKIGESEIYKYNEDTLDYDRVKYDVYDNKITLGLEFYKNQDGLYNYTLPSPYFNVGTDIMKEYYVSYGNDKNELQTEVQKGISTSNYDSIYNFAFPIDNKRYTVLKRNPNTKYNENSKGRTWETVVFPRDIGQFEYSVYINEVDIEIDKGFITPSSIAQQISEQLDKRSETKIKTMTCWNNNPDYTQAWSVASQQVQGGITTETETFKLFDCATRRTFYEYGAIVFNDKTVNNQDAEVLQYEKNFENILCYNPSVFLSGRLIQRDLRFDNKQVNHVFLNQIDCSGITNSQFKEYEMFTNIPYDESILQQYDYLFKYIRGDAELYENKPAKYTESTPDNSVFLHVDALNRQYDSLDSYRQTRFGTDYPSSAEDRQLLTNPLYLTYDSNLEGFQSTSAYGVFYPWTTTDGTVYCMVKGRFYIEADNLANPFFRFYVKDHLSGPLYGGTHPTDKEDYLNFPLITHTYSRIGFDRHFSAQGNQCLMLYNGLGGDSALNVDMKHKDNSVASSEYIYTNSFCLNSDPTDIYYYDLGNDQIYLGADSVLFNYSTVESRFTLSQLHTSRKQFNTALSGFDASVLRNVATDAAGEPDIFYNPTLVNGNKDVAFPLSINPNGNTAIYEISPTTQVTGTQEVAENYQSLKTNTIFDSNCGVYFSFFGIDSKTYSNSLWDILGFSKIQTNTYMTNNIQLQEVLYRSNRFFNSGVNLKKGGIYPFTTNAQINSNEIVSWKSNPFNISYFNTLNIPNNFRVLQGKGTGAPGSDPDFAFDVNASPYRVIQNQQSTLMYAERLPRKTNIPFFQVRSDILPMVKYYGGNKQSSGRLPVLALVNKSFSGTDFFVNQGDNSMEFIIKRRTTLNSITTEIYDSGGLPAVLDAHSSVIYKIEIPYTPPNITQFETSEEFETAQEVKNQKKK